MTNKQAVAVVLVVAAVFLAAATTPGEALSCSDLQSRLLPCVPYLNGGSGAPSQSCCSGVRSVLGSMRSSQDRRSACNCIKSAAPSYGVRWGPASSLPGRCGVSLGYSISPSIDCSRVR